MAKRKPDPMIGPYTYRLLDREVAPGIDLHEPMTAKKAAVYVGRLYDAIRKNFNEEGTRKLFAPYGRALTKDDIRIRRAADLVLKYWIMKPVPNARELAKRVADPTMQADARKRVWTEIGRKPPGPFNPNAVDWRARGLDDPREAKTNGATIHAVN